MRGRLWLEIFIKVLKENEGKLDYSDLTRWTESMGLVMDKVGEKLHCGVYRKRPKITDESEEYLGIDFMFFYKKDYDEGKDVLPIVIVEHENRFDKKYIEYCLWKILCIRSSVKVLICYQSNANNVASLRHHLEDIIWQGDLMKGTTGEGDLLVVIGDESVENEASWGEYFSIFEWRNDRIFLAWFRFIQFR